MAILRESTDLDKKPVWYLFLASNVLVLLGCVITYIIFARATTNQGSIYFVPSLVCNIVAIILCGLFIWLEAKNTMPKAVHFQRKWLWWYLSALIVFVCSIIFNFAFLMIYYNTTWTPGSDLWPLIIYMVVTGVLTLIAIGLQRYARFKIDLDIYRRKHGELPKKEEIEKDKAKVEKQQAKQDEKASSGLADIIDKQ